MFLHKMQPVCGAIWPDSGELAWRQCQSAEAPWALQERRVCFTSAHCWLGFARRLAEKLAERSAKSLAKTRAAEVQGAPACFQKPGSIRSATEFSASP